MLFKEILNNVYLGNTVFNYLTSIGVILLGLVLIFIFNHMFLKKQKMIIAAFDRLAGRVVEVKLQKYVNPLLYIILFYASIKNFLTLTDKFNRALYIIFIAAVTYYAIRLISAMVKTSLTSYLKKSDKDPEEVERRVRGISTFNNIIIWILGIIFIISNTGFNIAAVITGLGIGGIALALASQNIFMDLFNYFVIFFDQPFQIGDFIVIDNLMGTVEKMGIKTTRLRSLTGEEIVISNTDLTSKRIHNYKKMEKRRAVFTLEVVYQTAYDQITRIPGIIEKVITSIENARFDRAHFKEFGSSGLIFEIVYFVLSADYNLFMDIRQKINLNIYREFKEAGISFAYPTKTVFIENTTVPGN